MGTHTSTLGVTTSQAAQVFRLLNKAINHRDTLPNKMARIALLMLIGFLVISSCQGACTMVDKAGVTGLFVNGYGLTVTTVGFSECKTKCLADSKCKGTRLVYLFYNWCLYFTTDATRYAWLSSPYAQKKC